MAIITAWLVFEFSFIYFMYPETAGRTLEELAFCKPIPESILFMPVLIDATVFENKEYADQAIIAVEKRIHHEDMTPVTEIRDKPGATEYEVARFRSA